MMRLFCAPRCLLGSYSCDGFDCPQREYFFGIFAATIKLLKQGACFISWRHAAAEDKYVQNVMLPDNNMYAL